MKIGALPVTLPVDVIRRIMSAVEDDPSIYVVVDVVYRRVAVPAIVLYEPLDIDDFHQYRMV